MSSQSRISIIFLVAASISLGFMCTDIYIPSMPHLARLFEVSEDSIQMTVACNLLGAVVAGLFAGTLSDSFGRRPLMLSGLVLFMIGSLTAALSPHFHTLLIGRFIQGCGVGIFN
ncbi:MAG: MFS transporter, partial [Alphaproteobacteria bacterium]|nr:MFS transporter [Alphaproteobacteria bacterium]